MRRGRASPTIETWLGPSFKELIHPSRHDEVVLVQTTDLVCPPGDPYLAPLGQQRGVVALLLGLLAHFVGEGQRPGEVVEPKRALQALDALALHDLPVRDLRRSEERRVGKECRSRWS